MNMLTKNNKVDIIGMSKTTNSSNKKQKFNKIQQRTVVTTYERRQSLLDALRKQPGLRVPELAQALDVSEGTVRNDLNALEDEGDEAVRLINDALQSSK